MFVILILTAPSKKLIVSQHTPSDALQSNNCNADQKAWVQWFLIQHVRAVLYSFLATSAAQQHSVTAPKMAHEGKICS